MTMPNFLIIGAAKAGSSSLHFYLAQHPEIYMTPNKQTYFFASEGAEPEFRGPGDEVEVNKKAITRLEDYEAQFAGVTTENLSTFFINRRDVEPQNPLHLRTGIFFPQQ